MREAMEKLLDDADRIVATDLHPARCRMVIADLAAALRELSLALAESREYGAAMVEELKARTERTEKFVAMAASMDEDFKTATDDAMALFHASDKALRAKTTELRALQDPLAVHLNMLRGTIAKPTVEQIIHLYGVDALCRGLAPTIVAEQNKSET